MMTRSFVANEKATSFTLGFDNGLYFVFVGTTAGEILKVINDNKFETIITKIIANNNGNI